MRLEHCEHELMELVHSNHQLVTTPKTAGAKKNGCSFAPPLIAHIIEMCYN